MQSLTHTRSHALMQVHVRCPLPLTNTLRLFDPFALDPARRIPEVPLPPMAWGILAQVAIRIVVTPALR